MTNQKTQKYRQKAIALLPKNAHSSLKDFVTALYADMPEEDLKRIDPEAMVETARLHWNMSNDRRKEERLIRFRTAKPQDGESNLGRTVIDIVSEDRAFLVDSVTAKITQEYKLIHFLVHPVMHLHKNKKGHVKSVEKKRGDDTVSESHLHIQLQGPLPDNMLDQLEKDLNTVMDDVKYATRDWIRMKEKLRACQKGLNHAPASKYNDEDIDEYLYFLEYLYKDNFTLLGYREYRFTEKKGEITSKIAKGSSLGLLHDDKRPVYINETEESIPEILQRLRRDQAPLTVSKVNQKSSVHRPVPMDAIAVKQFDKKGNVIGEALFLGLFTSVTYSRSIKDIPLLSRKIEKVMRYCGFNPGSHDFKALNHILEKYPRDELFQIDLESLVDISTSILSLQERQRIALYMRPDPFGRYVSCLVYIPRDRYDTALRIKMKDILEEDLQGERGSFFANVDDSPFARVLYFIYTDHKNPPKYNAKTIEKKLQNAGRLWSERLSDALYQELDNEDDITRLSLKYGFAFPENYCDDYTAKQSYYDILRIEEVLDTNRISLDLYSCKGCSGDEVRLKIFNKGKPVALSEILPILENMGLKAMSEVPYEIKPSGVEETIFIHDFLLQEGDQQSGASISAVKDAFEDALQEVWSGRAEDDSLNSLVLSSGMPWRNIVILRTYVRYLKQMGFSYDTSFVEGALTNAPKIAKEIVSLFHSKFDPETATPEKEDTKKQIEGHLKTIEKDLEDVSSLDEDRILRSITNLVENSLRTNFYQPREDGLPKEYLSIKLDSRRIKNLPAPRPYREIFVYAPDVEAVHLRGDVIARGGIRWSDRPEDFRTEVLGLMKAQQVKNSVIVPMGAKGGFIVKNPLITKDRKAKLDQGIACYKTFIRGLLDITDNRKGKRVVTPKNVVRWDGTDPYLVVAADKGTASFSDIANGLSGEYGFWLGDAFASGGSAGYDHKIMGITAKGAWESVKRHFRELNHDTQTQDFEVIGIGDMGGDVFGNGMLLSEHIRLIGAFNHLHIFCDPDPDTAKSYKERKRLFDAVKGWDEYDTKKLSKGGRIYNRNEKSLKLTPEICKRFDIESDTVSPNELLKVMLKARTDLLWFGGIGTYIKATSESNADVGDKANDPLRINAPELRAKVIGEGANLAVTQLARIEYAKQGGKLNADFIDNSGGVDSSDHEVNIKILLADVMSSDDHKMTLPKRNKLLAKMTDEVASLVLRHNYLQTQGISLTEGRASDVLPLHAAYMTELEKTMGLNREIEYLPNEEQINERLSIRKGLTRPEIGILHSYAKIDLTRKILASRIPDQEHIYNQWLLHYFPHPLRKAYEKEIMRHRLKREIVATRMADSIVNRLGPSFIKFQMDKTGSTYQEVIKAYLIVRDIFDLKTLWSNIEALDNKVPAEVQLNAMQDICDMVDRGTTWFLTKLGRELDIEKDVELFKNGIDRLLQDMSDAITPELGHEIETKTQMNIRNGLPEDLAKWIAHIPTLGASGDIVLISENLNTDIITTAKTYLAVGENFYIKWLTKQASFLTTDDKWSEQALDGLIEQLYACQAGLTTHILDEIKKRHLKNASTHLDVWCQRYDSKLCHFKPFFEEIKRSGKVDIPILLIAEQKLRHLFGG